MKTLILSILLLVISSFANATSMSYMTCELSNKDYFPQQINLTVYTSTFFGEPDNVQIVYSFPEFGSEVSLSSALEGSSDDAGVFSGQISNGDYLVYATLDTKNSLLKLTDDGEVYLFSGECSLIN